MFDLVVDRSFQIIWNAATTTTTSNVSSQLLRVCKNHYLSAQQLCEQAISGWGCNDEY